MKRILKNLWNLQTPQREWTDCRWPVLRRRRLRTSNRWSIFIYGIVQNKPTRRDPSPEILSRKDGPPRRLGWHPQPLRDTSTQTMAGWQHFLEIIFYKRYDIISICIHCILVVFILSKHRNTMTSIQGMDIQFQLILGYVQGLWVDWRIQLFTCTIWL